MTGIIDSYKLCALPVLLCGLCGLFLDLFEVLKVCDILQCIKYVNFKDLNCEKWWGMSNIRVSRIGHSSGTIRTFS